MSRRYGGIAIVVGLLLVLTVPLQRRATPEEIELYTENIQQTLGGGDTVLYKGEAPLMMVLTDKGARKQLEGMVHVATIQKLVVVDYSQFVVIAVFQGVKPSAGYLAQVRRVVREGRTVTVYGNFTDPVPDQEPFGNPFSPYHVFAVSKAGLEGQEIRFVLEGDGENISETTVLVP